MPTKRPRRETRATISGQLREIIADRGQSAYALARSAGVARTVVSRFLTRERGLTLDTLDAIAAALGLRLVETGRGRGRATNGRARAEAGPVGSPGVDGPEGAAP